MQVDHGSACSSSAVALGEPWLRIASSQLDLAIAGGTEAPLSLGSMKAWEAMQTLAAIDREDECRSSSARRIETGLLA